jgi:hypothetical protein
MDKEIQIQSWLYQTQNGRFCLEFLELNQKKSILPHFMVNDVIHVISLADATLSTQPGSEVLNKPILCFILLFPQILFIFLCPEDSPRSKTSYHGDVDSLANATNCTWGIQPCSHGNCS